VVIDARSELPAGELSQTGRRQFQKLLADLGLSVAAITFPTRRGYDDLENLERRVMATQAAMKFANSLGATVVVNHVGQVPEDQNDPRFVRMVEMLTGLGVYGERVGSRLAAQTGTESGSNLAKLLSALPEQTVGVDFHPGRLIHHGFSPAEAISALARNIIHFHACDAVRDFARGQVTDVEIGRGAADLPALLGQLEEFNYRGWVTIECTTSEPVGEAENAVAFLRSL
jgi:sugar phosphate isomerase/epimerase